jgi:hypothetical protein
VSRLRPPSSNESRARRVVALLLLVAVLFVVLAGAAHAADADHEHGGCSLCLAYLVSAVATLVASGFVLALVLAHRRAAFRAVAVPLAARRGFLHAARGPPADA